jgi:large subunit ribosomal protein L30
MLGVLRLRGSIKIRHDIKDTLKILGLDRVNTLAVLPDDARTIGMIRKVDKFVAWGTLSDEILQEAGGKKIIHLKPPKGGLKSIKRPYPRGNLGYNGNDINKLIKKMM